MIFLFWLSLFAFETEPHTPARKLLAGPVELIDAAPQGILYRKKNDLWFYQLDRHLSLLIRKDFPKLYRVRLSPHGNRIAMEADRSSKGSYIEVFQIDELRVIKRSKLRYRLDLFAWWNGCVLLTARKTLFPVALETFRLSKTCVDIEPQAWMFAGAQTTGWSVNEDFDFKKVLSHNRLDQIHFSKDGTIATGRLSSGSIFTYDFAADRFLHAKRGENPKLNALGELIVYAHSSGMIHLWEFDQRKIRLLESGKKPHFVTEDQIIFEKNQEIFTTTLTEYQKWKKDRNNSGEKTMLDIRKAIWKLHK